MLRKPYYDILRVTAILLVLINHLPIYRLFMSESGMAEAGSLMISVITRINVPLFAMISGALLLGREESYGDIWKKRMKNMLLVTVGCSALLYLAFGLLRDRDLSLDTFLYGLLAGNLKDFDSYWFLYAYIGFLLFLPFYRHIAQQMTKGDFFLLLGVHATLTTVLPLINLMFKSLDLQQLTISSSISTTIAVTPLVFYPLIGYYVDKKIDVMSISKKGWATLGTATALGIAITAIAVYAEGKAWGFTQNLLNLFTFVVVIAFFLGIKRLYCQPDSNSPTLFVRMMTFLSPLCFGVYLLDPVLKLALYEPLKSALRPTIGYAGFSVVMCLVSFVCCSAVTWCFLRVRKCVIHKKKG